MHVVDRLAKSLPIPSSAEPSTFYQNLEILCTKFRNMEMAVNDESLIMAISGCQQEPETDNGPMVQRHADRWAGDAYVE